MTNETNDRAVAREQERASREYDAAVTMLQDTGQTVWLLNGAYLLAVTVLLGALFSLRAQACPPHSILTAGGLVGLALCFLWWGSFERAYSFYNFRMDFARSLESRVGYDVLTLGKTLSDGEVVKIGERSHRIHRVGRLMAMQGWTRSLICLFAILFLLTAIGLP